MKKFRQALCIFLSVLFLGVLFPTSIAAAATTNDITKKIDALRPIMENQYWNGKKTQSDLEQAVKSGRIDATSLGITPNGCKGSTKITGCKSNTFNGATQCNGFSQFIAYYIFGESGYVSKWKEYSGKDIANLTFQPGDRIGTKGHHAIVWKVENGKVFVIECWGSYREDHDGCLINFGYFNGKKDFKTENDLKNHLITEKGGYVQRNPNMALSTPAPSVEEPAQNPAQKPSISVSGNNTPGSLQQGSNFGIRGTVYTDCGMITELYGAIYDSNGNAVQTSRHNPNASSVNLRYSINNDLVFGNLGAGSYTYYVEATAVNGGETATNTVIYDSFNVYSNEPEQTPTEPPQQPPQETTTGGTDNNMPADDETLRNIVLTGDQRVDLVTVAKSQIGYHEGNNSNDIDGKSQGKNNYTKYGLWFGRQDAWCAIFVSWCANKAGISNDIIAKSVWPSSDDFGCVWHGRNADRTEGINYTPVPGDLIIFDWKSNNFCTKSPASFYGDHVGIVTEVAGGIVYTVEGNSNNKVRAKQYSLSDENIKGYAVPNYTNTAYTSVEEPVQNPAQKPSISVSGNNTPGSLQQGSNFGIRGTVYTDCGMITELYGAIYDSNGNAVQTSRHSPNASSADLRYTINNDLVFGNLGAGSYTYYVEATAVNGSETTTNTVIYENFTIYSNEPEQTPAEPPQQPVQNPAQKPSISVSGNNTPGSLQQGSNFGIRGTVYTDCGMITELYGAIYDSNGNAVQTSRHSPNASSADLRYTINNDLVFGNLGAGSYTYYVEAAAVNGSETTTSVVINNSFNVYSNQPSSPKTEAPSVDEPELDSLDCYMTVNVGAGSTLRFCSTVSVADQYELGSIPNDASVYVYGTTKQQYEDRTWAKINYNGRDGWVNYNWLAPQASAPTSSYPDVPYPIEAKECWMTVNVGQGSTLSFRSDVYVEESAKICTLRDGTSIYVYGTTTQQYNGITWARVNYNNQDGWVDYKWLA